MTIRETKTPSQRPGPLTGTTILVTRASQAWLGTDSLRVSLESMGANVVIQPAIEIRAAVGSVGMDDSISRIAAFDWVVFVSGNGVHFFVQRLHEKLGGIEVLGQLKFATIGDKTAEQLKRIAGVDSSLSPESSDSESLAEALVETVGNGKVLLIRGNRGSSVLADRLSEARVDFQELVAYESHDVSNADPEIIQKLKSGQIDWVTITSSAIARSSIAMLGDELKRTKIVSISPTTSQALEAGGVVPTAEAKQFNVAGMVKAILDEIAL